MTEIGFPIGGCRHGLWLGAHRSLTVLAILAGRCGQWPNSLRWVGEPGRDGVEARPDLDRPDHAEVTHAELQPDDAACRDLSPLG
jgi:hypothetical protein